METCWKCGGDGYIPKYKHIENGKCFACNGTGKLSESRQREISQEAFAKGTKKGGRTKHLFKVNPKHLDKKQLEKFRTRIKTRAKEYGVKLKAGFQTESALKKLYSAFKEQTKEDDVSGHRLDPNEPSNSSEESKPETKKEETEQKSSGNSKEDKSNKYNDVKLTYKDGKYYNEEGIRVINPLNEETYDVIGKLFTGKKLGDSKLPNIDKSERLLLTMKHDEEKVDFAFGMLEDIIETINETHKGLIANVGLSEFGTDSSRGTSVGGLYDMETKKLTINAEVIIHHMNRQDINNLSKENKKKVMGLIKQTMVDTVVHELSHAFHQQTMYDYEFFTFAKESKNGNKQNDKVINAYNEAFERLPKPFNDKGLTSRAVKSLLGMGGFNQSDVNSLKATGYRTNGDIRKELVKQVPSVYALFNMKEFFAVLSAKFLTNPREIRREYPQYFRMLDDIYGEVMDIDSIQENYDKGHYG
jgi:hypothetical protein